MADGPLSCGECGAGNAAGARFCNQCGSRLGEPQRSYTPRHLQDALSQPAALQGERKRVTVLFADIKGSTRLAEQAGAELWHEVLDGFFGILSRVVHDYEGTLNQYTGDGVMALFGAPRALEDHAQFAARAALEMQAEVRRFADDLRLKHGLNLSMRVGLNSGEVVVGRIGDGLRSDYTAQGPTVNLAARMEHICEPGRIYLSRDCATLLEGYFRLRALGETQVAGLDQPVEVFELESGAGMRTRLDRSLARSGSPFIGREHELQRLLAAIERVRDGNGQVVAVVGNAGIGKSRLCHEFANACARSGIDVLRATGVPYASRVPLFPVRQLLRAKLGVPENATAPEARRWIAGALLLEDQANAAVLPYVFDFLGIAETRDAALSAAPGSDQMMARLAHYLPCDAGAAAGRPQVLLVEDLHFVDRATEDFLLRLVAEVRAHRCLLLLNFRPDYASDWLQPQVDESIMVSALQADQLERLAGNLLGGHASVQPLTAIVAERANGNPFFVEEAVQALAEGGWLQGQPRDWRLVRAIQEWPLPDSVQALLAARVDRLPDRLRARLQSAAVIGQAFDVELLCALSGEAVAVVEQDLAALEELGFVHHRDEQRYAFCHPLVQEVTYRTQLEAHRRTVHARLAAILETRHPETAEQPDEIALRIADHWQRSGEWAHAGRWNLIATRWALTQNIGVTQDQFQRALANYDRAPDSADVRRARIAARAGLIRLAQFITIGEAEIDRVYDEARALADDCGEVPCRVELLISYGSELLHRGQVDAALRIHEEAIQLCMDAGMAPLINRFRLAVLQTFNAAGHVRRIVEILDIAGSDWRERAVDEENYMSRGFYGLTLAWRGRLAEAAAHLQESLHYAQQHNRAASWMHVGFVDLASFTGELASALPAAMHALEQAEKFGSAFFRAFALRGQGMALCLNGRYEEAREVLNEALPLVARGANAYQFESNVLALLAAAELGCGNIERAEGLAHAARRSALTVGAKSWEIVAWLVWLRLPVSDARRAEAQEGLARMQALIDFTGAEGYRPWLYWAQRHWAPDPRTRAEATRRAEDCFRSVGADGYVKLLAERRAQRRVSVSESA